MAITVKSLTRPIRARFKLWRDRRFLKKMGCNSWRHYQKRYDPDVNPRGYYIRKEHYFGYPHVHCVESRDHHAYTHTWHTLNTERCIRFGVDDIIAWCDENCTQKFNFDCHRVVTSFWKNEWKKNDIGGSDYYFFAFKSEHDYLLFLLRWS